MIGESCLLRMLSSYSANAFLTPISYLSISIDRLYSYITDLSLQKNGLVRQDTTLRLSFYYNVFHVLFGASFSQLCIDVYILMFFFTAALFT